LALSDLWVEPRGQFFQGAVGEAELDRPFWRCQRKQSQVSRFGKHATGSSFYEACDASNLPSLQLAPHERLFHECSRLRFESAAPLNEFPEPLLQLIQVEKSRHELQLTQADFKKPEHVLFHSFQGEISHPSKSPCRGMSAKSIMRLYSPRLSRPRARPREIDHVPCAPMPV
jgi:hypothetical protein